jgi:voltage-gated potassium channel
MDDHVVVIGYGTKGRSAVETLVNDGVSKGSIIIVDPSKAALRDADADGIAVVSGDATRREVLRRADVHRARQVIIGLHRDDSTVLCTLAVRQLNPNTYVLAAVREQSNVPLIQQSGANAVITSSEAVGRLVGLAAVKPTLGSVLGDLLTYGQGLEVAERDLLVQEVGQQPQQIPDPVIAVERDGRVHHYFDLEVSQLAPGDRLILVRRSPELP